MAYIRKLANGNWRAEVERAGVRESAVRPTKAEASAWAIEIEADLLAGKRGKFPAKTLAQTLDRYELEISAKKASGSFEVKRFAALKRDHAALVSKQLCDVTSDDLARWRDLRQKEVKDSTVRREINTLRNVWTVASKEWKWCPVATPWPHVRKPEDGPPRERRVRWQEVRDVVRRLGYRHLVAPASKQEELAFAWLISLATAMRAGEVMGLEVDDVDLTARVVRLGKHKTQRYTGGRARFVPIFPRAARLLQVLVDQARQERRQKLFTLSNQSRDALFRKITDQLLIEALTYHDSRGEALTLLARRVDVMTLAKISGHKDLNLLLNTYYRETPAQIAARLK